MSLTEGGEGLNINVMLSVLYNIFLSFHLIVKFIQKYLLLELSIFAKELGHIK